MLDFLKIATRTPKQGVLEVFPKFKVGKSSDLMIRGNDFYAIWVEERGLWSTDEEDVTDLIDRELTKYVTEHHLFDKEKEVHVMYMWDSDSGSIDRWHKYCQKQCRDSFHMLDEKLIFSNTDTSKKDYASKRLNYPLEPGETAAYEKIMSTLYSPEERHKLEWAIGSIVTGDSKKIQKFLVLYGAAGTGKSTILNIIQQLFEGYYSVFDARALGSSSNSFALEAFKTNPLVAIQHDGDLSKIEDNTRLNSLVSHEMMTINEKFKSTYANRFKCFLFMGTNKPVKITDGKSGLIRRLIDVSPSGKKLSRRDYTASINQVGFELGAIACHCRDVYLDDPNRYDSYIPISMLGASNDFYNFVIDSYSIFVKDDGVTLKAAWEMYKTYCDEAKVPYPFSQRTFKEELRNYFWNYDDRFNTEDGTRVRSYYSGFRTDIFENEKKPEGKTEKNKLKHLIEFKEGPSIFDKEAAEYPAQYANKFETPLKSWSEVTTKLSDLSTSKLHYIKVPDKHIVIDFDIKDENGEKSYDRNVEAASLWPKTYAELSKSGKGVHLHYIYDGDVSKLSCVYDDNIEVKVFSGNSSLRRKLTKCNDIPIATISSGLPLKGDTKLLNKDIVQTERGLRTTIKKCLNKEVHAGTKSNIDFIYKILDDAYTAGIHYDVTDTRNAVYSFAANSTNNASYCIKLVNTMKFKSEEPSAGVDDDSAIVFYDVEVFPNLFLVNYKMAGEGNPIIRLINPKSSDIEALLKFKLVGFNNRRYDNHMLYARLMGYSNIQIYNLSQRIITSPKGESMKHMFGEAYNLSYTDIYDFASAGNKMSLKKLEIKMGIHHQELGLPWGQPVPEELWEKVAEYCDNDVIATEAAFNYLSADWTARLILADLAGMTPNDTTNTLTTRIIFGNNRKPQDQFNYRNMAEPVMDIREDVYEFLAEACPNMMQQTHGKAGSLLPYFPGYTFEYNEKKKSFVSMYRGDEVGEGGYVYAEPGMYVDIALLDVSSMHPHSAIAECLFGVKFTKAFRDIVEGRVSIKHEAWDVVNTMLDGKLTPYIQKVIDGTMTSGDLANALKTAINSVYGLTSASFSNPFHDPRNRDNIVAKRGALFMIDLKNEVQERGFTVAHIKTDSIKIPNATLEIINFVMDFGLQYGYTFEHEATYERMCLINDAVYIAKYKDPDACAALYGYSPKDNKKKGGQWSATGKQFAVPYVFKKLFSKEAIEFEDVCETFAATKGELYLDMNEKLPDVSMLEKELAKHEADFKKEKITESHIEKLREEYAIDISKGHDYKYVGKVGLFCPIKPGASGGVLYRYADNKYYAAPGTTGFRWLESEMVENLGLSNNIDYQYYDGLVDGAVDVISQYGDFTWFVSNDN